MLIVPYATQLKWYAREKKVELSDAVREAGLSVSTYQRLLDGSQKLSQTAAEQIAAAIKGMSAD